MMDIAEGQAVLLPGSRTYADMIDAWADSYFRLGSALRGLAADMRVLDEAASFVVGASGHAVPIQEGAPAVVPLG